jgi:hypothetical protein
MFLFVGSSSFFMFLLQFNPKVTMILFMMLRVFEVFFYNTEFEIMREHRSFYLPRPGHNMDVTTGKIKTTATYCVWEGVVGMDSDVWNIRIH